MKPLPNSMKKRMEAVTRQIAERLEADEVTPIWTKKQAAEHGQVLKSRQVKFAIRHDGFTAYVPLSRDLVRSGKHDEALLDAAGHTWLAIIAPELERAVYGGA